MTPTRKSIITDLIKFDRQYGKGHVLIGTDEAGRGPVAGPVVAAAVYFPKLNKKLKESLMNLNDSKKLSAKKRNELYEIVVGNAIYSVQQCSIQEIEKHNILQASLIAMGKASQEVINQIQKNTKEEVSPKILVDGRFTIKNMKVKQVGIIKGDSQSASIAAASILAKVSRDKLMIELAEKHPVYDWHKNKGYPTPAHLEAIRNHGQTKWHRKSFLTKCL